MIDIGMFMPTCDKRYEMMVENPPNPPKRMLFGA